MHEELAAEAGAADQDFLSSPGQEASKIEGGSPINLPMIQEDSDSPAPKSKGKASVRSKSKRGTKKEKATASKKKQETVQDVESVLSEDVPIKLDEMTQQSKRKAGSKSVTIKQ